MDIHFYILRHIWVDKKYWYKDTFNVFCCWLYTDCTAYILHKFVQIKESKRNQVHEVWQLRDITKLTLGVLDLGLWPECLVYFTVWMIFPRASTDGAVTPWWSGLLDLVRYINSINSTSKYSFMQNASTIWSYSKAFIKNINRTHARLNQFEYRNDLYLLANT